MSPSLEIYPVPFDPAGELFPGLHASVPGHPFLPIPDSSDLAYEEKVRDIRKYLWRHLSTHRLKRRYKILWLLARSGIVSTLGHQAITNRQIVVTERPDLHLLWGDGKMYVKPVPEYLLNHDFFARFVAGTSVYDPLGGYSSGSDDEIDHSSFYGEALGFLHTWYYLIQHRSDFELARQLGLMPKSVEYEQWAVFIRPFKSIPYTAMAPRFHYGDLRLGRMNLLTRLCGYSWSYLDTERYYYDTLTHTFGVYAFGFTGITVMLSSLQTAFMIGGLNRSYLFVLEVLNMVTSGLVLLCFVVFPIYFVVWLVREGHRLEKLNEELRDRDAAVSISDPIQAHF